jgi:Arylsulfotransferase (ASST)
VHPHRLLSETQGGMQVLPNGNVFVGWGSQPAFSEFDSGGRLLFDGRIGEGNDNYRAYRGGWTGRPETEPALVVDGGEAVASWNGATEVVRWQLLAGDRRSALRPAGLAPRTGFETSLPIPAGARWVAARALGPRGGVLAESPPVPTGGGG